MNLEEHNLGEIEGLSQRGRTLSIVDLINANTLDVDMAAYSLCAIANGASFLTAARPGNAGKTTLMACMMTFLPPGIRIVTTSSPDVIERAQDYIDQEGAENLCFLCHEIGSGRWYGYLWGRYVGRLLHLISAGCRVASCIHADTLPEIHNILVSRELGVSEADFSGIELLMFMKLERSLMGYIRRVATFYEADESGKHKLLFRWDPESDTFNRQNSQITKYAPEEIQQCRNFIEGLMRSGETDFRWVRKQVVEFYPKLDTD